MYHTFGYFAALVFICGEVQAEGINISRLANTKYFMDADWAR